MPRIYSHAPIVGVSIACLILPKLAAQVTRGSFDAGRLTINGNALGVENTSSDSRARLRCMPNGDGLLSRLARRGGLPTYISRAKSTQARDNTAAGHHTV